MKTILICSLVCIVVMLGFTGCPDPNGGSTDPASGTITMTLTDAAAAEGSFFIVQVYDAIPTGQDPVGTMSGTITSGTCQVVVQGYDANTPGPDGTAKEFDAGTYYILPIANTSYTLPDVFITINLDGDYSGSVSYADMEDSSS